MFVPRDLILYNTSTLMPIRKELRFKFHSDITPSPTAIRFGRHDNIIAPAVNYYAQAKKTEGLTLGYRTCAQKGHICFPCAPCYRDTLPHPLAVVPPDPTAVMTFSYVAGEMRIVRPS